MMKNQIIFFLNIKDYTQFLKKIKVLMESFPKLYPIRIVNILPSTRV